MSLMKRYHQYSESCPTVSALGNVFCRLLSWTRRHWKTPHVQISQRPTLRRASMLMWHNRAGQWSAVVYMVFPLEFDHTTIRLCHQKNNRRHDRKRQAYNQILPSFFHFETGNRQYFSIFYWWRCIVLTGMDFLYIPFLCYRYICYRFQQPICRLNYLKYWSDLIYYNLPVLEAIFMASW